MARRKKSTSDVLFFWYGLIAEIIVLIFAAFDNKKKQHNRQICKEEVMVRIKSTLSIAITSIVHMTTANVE